LKLFKKKGAKMNDTLIKQCKLCGKEYNENENFSWKCRTHWSAYGGELWWCCGKRGKHQKGCKLGKHQCIDDEEIDEEDEED
jgi:hypothetical protein